MGYQAVYLVENGYQEDAYRYVNTDVKGDICFETGDGLRVRQYGIKAFYLYRRPAGEEAVPEEMCALYRVAATLYVTDSRVVLHARGDQNAALQYQNQNPVPMVRSAASGNPMEEQTFTMAGMIRYEWLSQISYQRKVSKHTEDCIRLYYRDVENASWYLDLIFDGTTNTQSLANGILHRACRFRLSMPDEKNDKELFFLTRYGSDFDIKPAADPRRYLSTIRFPTQYPAPA